MTKRNRSKGRGRIDLSVTVYPEDIAAAYAELGLQRGCLQGRNEDDPLLQQIHERTMEHAINRALRQLDKPPQGRA